MIIYINKTRKRSINSIFKCQFLILLLFCVVLGDHPFAGQIKESDIDLDPLSHISVTTFPDQTVVVPHILIIKENSLSEPIFIEKHPKDGQEVSSFYFNHIIGGELFIPNDMIPVANKSCITVSEAHMWVVFKPFENYTQIAGFDVWSSDKSTSIAAQSDATHVTVNIIAFDNPPIAINARPKFFVDADDFN